MDTKHAAVLGSESVSVHVNYYYSRAWNLESEPDWVSAHEVTWLSPGPEGDFG